MSVFLFFLVPQSDERADDFVGVDYVMKRTNLKRRTILERKAGTHALRRVSVRPALWRRADVDNFVRQQAEGKKKKKGLVRRQRERIA